MNKIGDIWFRFEDVAYSSGLDEFDMPLGSGSVGIRIQKYFVTKVTPKGVWLTSCFWANDISWSKYDRFVRNNARKRFACPTEQEALESFVARKKAQRKIYKHRLNTVNAVLKLVSNESEFLADPQRELRRINLT